METARFIRKTQQEFGIPTVSVTHDLEEAFAMSDRIGVLLDGRLRQFDTPKQVYFKAASPEVAKFLGPVNTIPKRLFALFRVNGNISGQPVSDEIMSEHAPSDPGQSDAIMARPENLAMTADADGPGRIAEKTFAGHYTAYRVDLKDVAYTVYTHDDRFRPGQRVALTLKPY
jgi:putative spermidine/putrescine transport system ATP-binding protein